MTGEALPAHNSHSGQPWIAGNSGLTPKARCPQSCRVEWGDGMGSTIVGLIPMAHVIDVARSVQFYLLLGFEKAADFVQEGEMRWAHLKSADANLFVTRASDPVVRGAQGVLFYLYSSDLVALRESLLHDGVNASPITYPFYMEKGEIRVEDPDGYCLLIGQAD